MAEIATMAQTEPDERPDARGTPPGQGTVESNGGKIGNPPFIATPKMRSDVEAWVRTGATLEDLAVLITAHHGVQCSAKTVERHFKTERQLGRAKLKVALGGKLVKMALEGDKTALIFWLRTQAKWNTRVEHVGADGEGPIKTFDLGGLDLDEKRTLLRVIDQLLAQHGVEEANGQQPAPSIN